MTQPDPTLRLTIDTQALADNWRALDRLSGNASAGAAVKANCYGLGVDACVPALRDAGCEAFFVAHWNEVEAVSRHVPAKTIAVLHGVINDGEIAYARKVGAIPVINSIQQAIQWSASGGGFCHLMVDTGINRLGVGPKDIGHPAVRSLQIDTLMSHLACADEDSAMNARQLEAYKQVCQAVPHKRASFANSAGIALGSDYAFDCTRPGLSLFGGVPRVELSEVIRQVAFVDAAILQTRTIEAGETIGYNALFRADRDMRVATVSLGYADGFLRSRGPENYMLHDGIKLPILGKVSMDMIVVDLSNAPKLTEGDWLSAPFQLQNAAQQSGLSQYELLTTLGHRFRTL
ncbi:MAG: alanine racemase [Pseudomonadota bacterium]